MLKILTQKIVSTFLHIFLFTSSTKIEQKRSQKNRKMFYKVSLEGNNGVVLKDVQIQTLETQILISPQRWAPFRVEYFKHWSPQCDPAICHNSANNNNI